MYKARLRAEQIYEAMVDDEAFAQLPTILAQSIGARSCVIHWRDSNHQAEVMAHSAYFSPEQMLDYAENFVDHDEWSNIGKQGAFINRVSNTKDFLDPSEYEGSVFYNEWIRAMGDDTYHCIGTVMDTERGLGLIGLHRGKGQTDFDDESLKELNRHIVHLRRMLTVRARLVNDTAKIHSLMALLDCNPAPMFAVTRKGRLVHANAAAEALLERGDVVRQFGGHLHATVPEFEPQLALALASAGDARSPGASCLVVRSRRGTQVELTLAPVADRGTQLVLVTGRDPIADTCGALVPLDGAEALAPRELLVARYVGMGLRNRDIAERMGLTEGTVKVYLHNLFAKVGVSSRTELALRVRGQAPWGKAALTFDN